jgi:hypothetical protein
MAAADFSSPEAVEVLLEWGADPTLQQNVRPVMGADSALGSVRLGRMEQAQQYTPYEFVLMQIFMDHMFGFASMRMDFKVINSALPAPKRFSDQRLAQLVRQFRTLAALSSAAGALAETEIAPLLQDDELLSNLAVKSLIPRTKRRWAQLMEREDGERYIVIWGFSILGEYRASMQAGRIGELTSREIMATAGRYKKMANTGGTAVYKYSHAIADHFYQFMIEYRAGGWDDAQDWVGPGEVLKWSTLVEVLQEPKEDRLSGEEHASTVDSNRRLTEDVDPGEGSSRNAASVRQEMPMKFEDDGEEAQEEVMKRLQSLISRLGEPSDDEDDS